MGDKLTLTTRGAVLESLIAEKHPYNLNFVGDIREPDYLCLRHISSSVRSHCWHPAPKRMLHHWHIWYNIPCALQPVNLAWSHWCAYSNQHVKEKRHFLRRRQLAPTIPSAQAFWNSIYPSSQFLLTWTSQIFYAAICSPGFEWKLLGPELICFFPVLICPSWSSYLHFQSYSICKFPLHIPWRVLLVKIRLRRWQVPIFRWFIYPYDVLLSSCDFLIATCLVVWPNRFRAWSISTFCFSQFHCF